MEGTENAVIDQPIETPVTTDPVETLETTEQVLTEGQSEVEQPDTDADGRTLPKDVQSALKALRESNPKEAKVLRESFFSNQQFRESFKNPNEAKAAKVALETIGGAEGAANLREQVQAAELLDQAAENGDPSIIQDWAKDFPDGFKKVMPFAIRQYQQMDAQGFAKAIKPHVYGVLESVQLGERLSEAFDAIEGGNKQQAQTLLRNVYAWLQNQKSEAEKVRTESADAQPDKLSEREKALNQKEENLFRGEIGRETYPYQQNLVNKALAPYLKGKNLSEKAKERLLSTVNGDINQNLKKDQSYQRQVRAYLAKKDANGVKSFIKGHLDTMVADIAVAAFKDLYGSTITAKPTQQTTAKTQETRPQVQGAPIRVTKKPSLAEVVKDNGYMEAYIAGKAIMAAGPMKGKLVTWR